MNLWIASDHAGYKMKEQIKLYLNELQISFIDLGTKSEESVDYPNYAFLLGTEVAADQNNLGILVCGTGIGMSIACNKVRGIRCAKVMNVEETILTRSHNNANVIAISSKSNGEEVKKIVNAFLKTPFSNEERHVRRVNQIADYEKQDGN